MALTYHAICLTVFLVLFLISFAYCKELKFKISTDALEDELTMRCSLSDTLSDIKFVQSISIRTQSGSRVASITAKTPARMEDNSIGALVSGQVQLSGQERGYLKIVWKHPVLAMNGMYLCQVSGVDKDGYVKTLLKSSFLDMFNLKLNDIIDYIRKLMLADDKITRANDELQLTNDKIKVSNDKIKLTNDEMKIANDELKLVNAAQNATIAELRKRQDTRVIFTAINNNNVYVEDGTNVVFRRVFINVGGGYDGSTGVFTCPVAGYYTFQVHILGSNDDNAEVSIMRNGNRITSAAAEPEYGHQTGSNAANVWLNRGDRVTVTAIQRSTYLYGEDFCSFSGHLISLA